MAVYRMKQSGHKIYGLIEYLVDKDTDINLLPLDDVPGSNAISLETGKIYYMNGKHEWIAKPAEGGNGATQAYVDAELAKKLDLMPGDEHTNGNAYNLPYYFSTSADANKVVVKAHTVSLDGNKTYGEYTMDVAGATSTTAGLMTAADKNKLDGIDLSPYAKTTEVNTTVNNAIADLIDGAPEALDTLKELADNFDGVATKTWVESKGYLTEALPEGTEAGQALVYNGEEWTKQLGYGYELAPETNINFDGDTDGLTEIATAYFPFFKLPYSGYLPQVDDLMGRTVYYKYNGSLETSEWNADDVQMSPEGTLELKKDNFTDTMIIVYDDTTMSKYDDGLFTKGIWVAKQDDSNYIMDIYFGPVITQIDSKFIPSDDNKANVDDVVYLNEDQTIGGEKEFTNPISFESGLSTTSYGQGGVSIGAFAQPLTKYNFATDGSDYVVDGELTVAAREWVENQGYLTSDSMPEICDNLETDDSNMALSAAQGVALKALIDAGGSGGATYTAGSGISIDDDNVISQVI